MEVVADFLFFDLKTDSVMSDSLQPHHCAYQAPQSMEFSRQITQVCCRFLLQRTLPTQVSAIHIEFTEYYFPDNQELPGKHLPWSFPPV